MIQFLWKTYLRLTNPSCTINAARLSRNVRFDKGVRLGHGAVVMADHIGKHTYVNDYCLIDKNVKRIGAFCSIAYNARIGLGTHPLDRVSTHAFQYDPKYGFVTGTGHWNAGDQDTIIGNDVWVGANATILAGVTIGDGAVIGAHSLVNEDVEPYSVVVGTPAKHLRYRVGEEQRKELLELQWWTWSDQRIKERIGDFANPDALLSRE